MFEKMCRVLDILHMRCGYDCDMRWSVNDGWTCHVNYIEHGPAFDYDVPLDGHILVQAPIVIASFIIGECQDAIEHFDAWPLEV